MEQSLENPNIPLPSSNKLRFAVLKFFLFVFIFSVCILVTYEFTRRFGCSISNNPANTPPSLFGGLLGKNNFAVEKFKSEEEFKKYLDDSRSLGGGGLYGLYGARNAEFDLGSASLNEKSFSPSTPFSLNNQGAYRVSDTNVQVRGIDEPDIVKVNEKNIFTSFQRFSYMVEPSPETFEWNQGMKAPLQQRRSTYANQTEIMNAFPPSELKKVGGIDQIGNLLLAGNILVIFTNTGIYGYDVTKPSYPNQKWVIPYEQNSYYKDARLYGSDILLVTETKINTSKPCPYVPLKVTNVNGTDLNIQCTQIYHPATPIATQSTLTVFKVDSQTGKVKNYTSLLSTGTNSILYVSPNNVYLTYSYSEDMVRIFSRFLTEEDTAVLPKEIKDKIMRLDTYDISAELKMLELVSIVEKYASSLSNEEKIKVEDNLKAQLDTFLKKHVREFEATGIVRMPVSNLSIAATGKVPGHPLNQFSLDEYKDNLRVATNCGTAMTFGTEGDVNDVYVLNSNLSQIGAVKDLGRNERIYSTRFMGNRGYVVTYKETDPFYVLDLSNPNSPQMRGALKIPGYSSYLHQLTDTLVLGIGKEDSNVKLSLFDVSDATNPNEVSKIILNDYWSEAVNNHHAFLLDTKHQIFFMPGASNGYVISYENKTLTKVHTIPTADIKRAVYLNDYLYIIGERGIDVLDENTWFEVKNYRFE